MTGTDRVDMGGPRDVSPGATTARPPDSPAQTRAALLGATPRNAAQAGALEQRAMQQLQQLVGRAPGHTPTDKLTNALKAAGLDDAAISQLRDSGGNISLTAAREALLQQIAGKNPQAAQKLANAPLGHLLAGAQQLNGQGGDEARPERQTAPRRSAAPRRQAAVRRAAARPQVQRPRAHPRSSVATRPQVRHTSTRRVATEPRRAAVDPAIAARQRDQQLTTFSAAVDQRFTQIRAEPHEPTRVANRAALVREMGITQENLPLFEGRLRADTRTELRATLALPN